ncbi:hypothetical protein ACN28S_14440 [Cystobacter fuscus]
MSARTLISATAPTIATSDTSVGSRVFGVNIDSSKGTHTSVMR